MVRTMRLGEVCGNIAHAILLFSVSWRRAYKVKKAEQVSLDTDLFGTTRVWELAISDISSSATT